MTLIQNRGAFLRRLTAGGSFTESQAEVLADALEGELGQPATKGDLGEVRAEVSEFRAEAKGEIAKLRAEMKGDMAELRAELKGDMAELRAELKGDIAELRAETKGEIGTLRAEMRAEIKGLGATLSERMDRIADRTLIRVTVAMAGLFGLAIAVLRLTGPPP
jgi:F0F1-type ATP synthase membrane subunit b/b'